MEGKSDRERLETLAHQKHQAREQEEAEIRLRRASSAKHDADLLAQDQEKTKDLLEYCKQQFAGFKLVPTGHEVAVTTASSSRMFGIQADGVEYVALNTSHWGSETNDFEGQIPLLYARFRNGEYHIVGSNEATVTVQTFDTLREKLLDLVSNMDSAFMKRLFEKVRDRLKARSRQH